MPTPQPGAPSKFLTLPRPAPGCPRPTCKVSALYLENCANALRQKDRQRQTDNPLYIYIYIYIIYIYILYVYIYIYPSPSLSLFLSLALSVILSFVRSLHMQQTLSWASPYELHCILSHLWPILYITRFNTIRSIWQRAMGVWENCGSPLWCHARQRAPHMATL